MAGPVFPTVVTEHDVRVGDLRLHYLDYGGEGPPLVFCHATGFHSWLWAPYAAALGDRFHVFALDQRGHGRSDKPPTGYRWENFGTDLAGFLDRLGLDEVRAVGHSKGATAIAAAAAAGCRRFARAVLIDPVLVPGPPVSAPQLENPLSIRALRRRNIWSNRAEMFERLRGKSPFDAWEEEFVRLYIDHGVADRPDGQVELLCPPEIEAQVYAEAPMSDGFGFLEQLAVPTLVIRGETSPTLPDRSLAEAVHRLPAGSALAIRGSGHFVPMERSKAVADALAGFLAR
jgi:pimeloyl-ACP methyl ester carboxylesterase